MKTYYERACVLLHIGSCFAMISPTLITVDQNVLDNKLSDSDLIDVDKVENGKLCRSEEVAAVAAIDPDIKEDSKLRVVRISVVSMNLNVIQINGINFFQPELIKKYKYDVEVHEVITSDGYILQMHRITGGPKSPPRKGKTPVFLMHGVLDSSAAWVVMRPNFGLGKQI